MIDFKALKIVHSYSYMKNDFFLLERSQLDYEGLSKKAGKNNEKLMLGFWDLMLCDEAGELLKLTPKDIGDVPMNFRKYICDMMAELASGQKKN